MGAERVKELSEVRYLKVLVVSLLLVQVLSVYFLWSLNTFTAASEDLFALFVSIDLVSFGMVSHAYRRNRGGQNVRGSVVLAGCCVVLVLMIGILLV